MLRVVPILAALSCILVCVGLPCRGESHERRLVWGSDDESPQIYKYEVIVGGEAHVEIVMIGR